jgi:type I restriction enzyme, S subunit
MNNWEQQILGNVADVKLSNVDKKTNEKERTIRLCNYTDVYKNSFINNEKSQSFMIASCNDVEYEKFILRKGQVSITKDSETPNDIGVSAYISEDFNDVVLGYHLSLITPNTVKLDGRFLHYWLNTKQSKRYFENNAGGSGQRCTLTLDTIKSIPLHLPPVKTQKSISKVLSDLEDKIELNNKINQELEAMAKLLYDYWFVQFDFPNEQGKPYKSSGGKMVYSKELKREIPVGWEVKTFGSYAKVKSGFAFKSTWWQASGIPVVKIKDIQEDYTLNQRDFSFVEEDKIKLAKKFICKVGDVVIAMTGATIGKFAVIPKTNTQLLVNQRVGLYDLGNEPFDKLPFLVNSMKQDFFRAKIFQVAGGAAQPNISGEQLDNFPIVKPNDSLIGEYNVKFKSLYKKIANNIYEIQLLTQLRDWLLPMLMNGQVTIKEAEEKLNMAAEPSGEYKTK